MFRLAAIFVFLAGVTLAAPPPDKLTLKELNLKPDLKLGQSVSVNGVLSRSKDTEAGRALLMVGYTAQSKPSGLKFVAQSSLAAKLYEAMKSPTIPVRVTGMVFAPSKVNAPYTIEVEEVATLADDGTIESIFKANPPEPKTIAAPPAAAPLTAPAVTVNEPVVEPQGLTAGTLLAAGIALFVGLSVGAFLLWKRKAPPPPPAASPTRSVSERLNRRVR